LKHQAWLTDAGLFGNAAKLRVYLF
jgi:hypothetical protein